MSATEHSIAGGFVARVCFDFRVEFRLLDTSEGPCAVSIGSPFTAVLDGHEYILDPEEPTPAVVGLIHLRNKPVREVRAHADGRLEIDLDGPSRIVVSPHSTYEAWELHSDSVDLVALPGGGVAKWNGGGSQTA